MPDQAGQREAERDRRLRSWASERGEDLAKLDAGQRWVIFAALTFLSYVKGLAPLRRVVAYVMCHCGLGFSTDVIGAVVGTTGRAVRNGRQSRPAEFWKRLQSQRRGHAPAKLRKDQVGPVAKFLAEHKRCTVGELLAFILVALKVEIDRLTLRRFLKRYGLGCLREDTVQDPPFLPAVPSTGEPSS